MTPPKKPAEPRTYNQPCRKAVDDRKSDLCAQWKAADAARDAALWAMIGTLVAALGTIGLYIQIILTRKAVEDTSEATEAMRGANVISEDAAKRQLRAYVSIRKATMPDLEPGIPILVKLEIENSGVTPANRFLIHWAWTVTSDLPSSKIFNDTLQKYPITEDEQRSFGPHQAKEVEYQIDIADEWRAKVVAREMQFYFMGSLRYRDAFGEQRLTEFFYMYAPNMRNYLGQAHVHNDIQ